MVLRKTKSILLLVVIQTSVLSSQSTEKMIDHFPEILAVQDSSALFSIVINGHFPL